MLTIKFIGTGSGKTNLTRNHSAILINCCNTNLLIDCGDGTSKALLQSNIDLNLIDAIFISHFHADHYSGIASLITQFKLNNRTKNLKIIVHYNLIETLKQFLNSVYMFQETLGFDITFMGYNFSEKTAMAEDIFFIAKQNFHIRKKEELILYPDKMFTSSSFLFFLNNKNIFITSDINSKEDLFLFNQERINYMVVETTHINTSDIYEAWKTLKFEKVFLTHIDEELERDIIAWHNELKEKEFFTICNDGLTCTI